MSKELYSGKDFKIVYYPGSNRTAKLFNTPIASSSRAAKRIKTLAEHQPMTNYVQTNGAKIGWPLKPIQSKSQINGYYIPTVTKKMWNIDELYKPGKRINRQYTSYCCKTLLGSAINLSRAFDMAHSISRDTHNDSLNCVVGNITYSNILVDEDANVMLINPEKYQVKYEDHGKDMEMHSRKGSIRFIPRENQDIQFSKKMLDPSHDDFGLAVLLYLLLMDGTHPFEYAKAGSDYTDHIDQFPEELQRKFKKAFLVSHFSPKHRPGAYEWARSLEHLKENHCDNGCLLKEPEKCFNNNTASECCLCHLSVKTVVALMLESPRPTAELTELLFKGPKTPAKTNKMSSTLKRLQKNGWVTARKFPAGKSNNYFAVTNEIILPYNRKRIYSTICTLISLIDDYPASTKRIKSFFTRLRNDAAKQEARKRITEKEMELLDTLATKGKAEALWQVTLIPYTQKILLWSLDIHQPMSAFGEFIKKNPFPVPLKAPDPPGLY